MSEDLRKQDDLAKSEGATIHVVKHGRKYRIEGVTDGWVTTRLFPAKWKAEIALEAFRMGGTFRTYCVKMSEARTQRGMAVTGCGPFQRGFGDWTQYRQLPSLMEADFHCSEYGRREGPREMPYEDVMFDARDDALEALKAAQEQGIRYVLFTYGASTSRPGKTTARSQVRGLMRSKEATPYICRRECIQHETVFVAAIRPKSNVRVPESS